MAYQNWKSRAPMGDAAFFVSEAGMKKCGGKKKPGKGGK